jgi:hypothetical protein
MAQVPGRRSDSDDHAMITIKIVGTIIIGVIACFCLPTRVARALLVWDPSRP